MNHKRVLKEISLIHEADLMFVEMASCIRLSLMGDPSLDMAYKQGKQDVLLEIANNIRKAREN